MKSSIVAFEGLNGVGKSTLAAAVAQALGSELVATPPYGSQERHLFDADPFSDSALLYYLSWVMRIHEQARRGVFGKLVICDRYLASTLAYFQASGKDIGKLIDVISIDPPAFTVLVTAEEDVRRSRLERRGNRRPMELASYDSEFMERALTVFKSSSPLYEVDTSYSGIDKLTCDVEGKLRKHSF